MPDERTQQLSDAKRALLAQWTRGRTAAAPALTIPRRAGTGPAPLSITQQRLWIIERLLPDTAAYHTAEGLRMLGALDVPAFRRAVAALVRRHEALRTVIVETAAGEPRQHVLPDLTVPVPLVDLTHLPEGEREAELQRLALLEGPAPFDLAQGPLFRLKLFRLGPEAHALVQVFHHIMFDGWSYGIYMRELAELYNAELAGRPAQLPDLPVGYTDFAVWEREYVKSPAIQAQLAWWKAQLAGKLPVLELPADRARPPVMTYRGRTIHDGLSPDLARALTDFSRREGVSPFMALVSAWSALLHRYSGHTDILVGTPVANRSRVELERVIGFFANTMVLRCDLTGDPTFRDLLARVKEVSLGALSHQELPFETLVEELEVDRSLSHSSVYQAGFSLLNVPTNWSGMTGLDAQGMRVDSGAARCDVWLTAYEEDGFMRLSLEYSADLFTEATARRMLGHYVTLLAAAVAGPDARITDLPLLTAPERQQLLVDWNQTAAPYPADTVPVIHRLIEAQAHRAPDRTAVICEGRRLTYGELNRQANRLARRLRSLGAGPGGLVGFCVERSLDLIVNLLAILKAGGAYVPLDPNYPTQRLAYMLENSQAAVLLTQSGLLARLPVPAGVRVLCADTEDVSGEPDADLEGGAGPDDLAYIIYTSGSTGQPKGVMIGHRNVVNLLCSMQREPGMTEHDVLAALTSVSFDIAGLELYLPLITGGTLVIVPTDTARDGRLLIETLKATGTTIMQATPVTWRILEETGWQPGPTLKMLVGGEALPRDLAARLTRNGDELWNMYGPTETTIWSTIWRVPAGAPSIAIGRPVANTQIYLLDGRLNPVPAGVPGELYIGGDGLARGYLNRPDLTAERFLATEYGRLYRTGDLARYLADGTIEFLGRVDQQLKVHGFRIEAGEIEVALSRHPAVGQAVVDTRPDVTGANELVGYIVPAAGAEVPAPAALTAFLKQTLPDYMVPSTFLALEQLPLTPNGKVDRRALPTPAAERSRQTAEFVAPRTPTEALLVSIWAEVLQLPQVSAEGNFFELGGHSLLGIRLLLRVREAFGVDLPLRTLYESPTVAEMAAAIDQRGGGSLSEATLSQLLGELEEEQP